MRILVVEDEKKTASFIRKAYEDAQILAQPNEVEVRLIHCEQFTIEADRHRLRQLLLNLTDNAIKHNQAKGVVTMALRDLKGVAEIKITNTGPGIPLEMQSRLFERFFRCDLSHGGVVEGCGLGLSIAHWNVSAHGGNIQITSLPEPLTTVLVTLPANGVRIAQRH